MTIFLSLVLTSPWSCTFLWPSAFLTSSTWMIKEASQIYAQSLLTSAFPQCPPPMSPAHFQHLPSWSRKSLGSNLDSSFSSPLYTQALWIPSPNASGSVLCLHARCKNLPSIPTTSCLHSYNSLPILPLPICFPRCSLYDLFGLLAKIKCMIFLNLNWSNLAPLLKTLQRDGPSVSDRDGITGTRFMLLYEITKEWYKIRATIIFKALSMRRWHLRDKKQGKAVWLPQLNVGKEFPGHGTGTGKQKA